LPPLLSDFDANQIASGDSILARVMTSGAACLYRTIEDALTERAKT
jgi:hypothetical protein